ncbi:MAG: hypothetical protein LUC06_00890 [Oscillospiraceae bacterium]|nr:hypothetical protein [Oscillospiraceae bacterium]
MKSSAFFTESREKPFFAGGAEPAPAGAEQVSTRTLLRGATLILGNLKLGLDFLRGMGDNL